MLQLLRSDHEELERFLGESDALLNAPDAEALKRQRWRFDRWLSRHLHTLRTDLYPVLERQRRPGTADRLRGLTRQTDDLHAAYERHKDRFPLENSGSDWADFQASAQLLIRQLRRLMDAQREELYPMLLHREAS